MTILQVCAYAAPYEGNFIKSLKQLEAQLKKRGIQTIYAFPNSAKEIQWCKELARETFVYFLPLAKARIKPCTYSALKHIYRKHPDIEIVHSHFELYDVPVVMTASKKMKVFWHLHDAIEVYSDIKNRLANKLQYGLFHKNAKLLAVCEKQKDYVIQLGFPRNNAYYVPNGLEISRIQCDDADRENRPYDFLMFGWDYEVKGVDLCVEACLKMQDTFKIAIVGGASTQARIKKEYGDVAGIDVINPVSDVNELYKRTRAFLHISRAEGLSYALLEAVYAGLPVVCSNIQANLFAKQFPTVRFVESENVSDIACGMVEVVEQLREDTAIIRAREIIEEEYSTKSWTRKMLTHYGVKDD